MTTRIPEDRWPVELQDFTRRNAGRHTIIEEQGGEFGAQHTEYGLPLRGVAYDRHGDHVEIMLGASAGTDTHLTRDLPNVRRIELLSDASGRDLALQVDRTAGSTILRFETNACILS